MTTSDDQPKPTVVAQYDDTSVLLVIQARPDGPIAPVRLTPDEVLGLVTGLAMAVDAFNAHRELIADARDAFGPDDPFDEQ